MLEDELISAGSIGERMMMVRLFCDLGGEACCAADKVQIGGHCPICRQTVEARVRGSARAWSARAPAWQLRVQLQQCSAAGLVLTARALPCALQRVYMQCSSMIHAYIIYHI